MKIERGTDDVFDDHTARFDHDDPADRARLAAFEPPPTASEQLVQLAELVDDAGLDPHDTEDLRQALRLVEVYRKQIAARLDRGAEPDKLRERVTALADQLLIAATQLGAAHQRIFDRPPLAIEARAAEGRKRGGDERGKHIVKTAAENRDKILDAFEAARRRAPWAGISTIRAIVQKNTKLSRSTIFRHTKDLE